MNLHIYIYISFIFKNKTAIQLKFGQQLLGLTLEGKSLIMKSSPGKQKASYVLVCENSQRSDLNYTKRKRYIENQQISQQECIFLLF